MAGDIVLVLNTGYGIKPVSGDPLAFFVNEVVVTGYRLAEITNFDAGSAGSYFRFPDLGGGVLANAGGRYGLEQDSITKKWYLTVGDAALFDKEARSVHTDINFEYVDGVTGEVIDFATSEVYLNDVVPTVSITGLSTEHTEGDAGTTTAYTFVVSRDFDDGPRATTTRVTWTLSGTGESNSADVASDFSGATSGTVTFSAGETAKTITVFVNGDGQQEGNEDFIVNLTANTNATLSSTAKSVRATITNDDTVVVTPTATIETLGSTIQNEGAAGSTTAYTYVIKRDLGGGGSGTSTVNWSVKGTGAAGSADPASDFSGATSGSVTFTGTETAKTITVNVAGDNASEANEQFVVEISKPTGTPNIELGATTSVTGTITNDDAPTASIAASGAMTQNEGGAGATTAYTYVITRDLSTGTSIVNWAVTGSGANQADGSDFAGGTLPSGSVTFAAGETAKTITVNVAGDTSPEQNEGFSVSISAPTGGNIQIGGSNTVTSTIANDDSPKASIAVSGTVPAAEGHAGSTAYTYVITRDSSLGTSTVNWAVSGSGTDQASASDFVGGTLPSGSVTFAAGETAKTITVNVAGDTNAEQNETFSVSLSVPGTGTPNIQLGATPSVTSTIVNDDTAAPPVAQFATANPAVTLAEGNAGHTAFTYVVTRDNSLGSSTVNWQVTGAGTDQAGVSDFAATSGAVSFAAGETAKTITVNVAGDTTAEQSEGFTITLTGGSNVTIGSNATGSGTITNDDAPKAAIAVTGTVPTGEGNAGATTAYTYVITRDSTIGGPSTVNWALGTGTADASDFTGPTSGAVTFTGAETAKTITINVAGDTASEPNETFSVSISAPTGGNIQIGGASSVTSTIVNDDAPSTNLKPTIAVGTGSTTGAWDTGPSVHPFMAVTIADADATAGEEMTLTIAFDKDDGVLELDGTVLVPADSLGTRTYTFTGTLAVLQERLKALKFNPTNGAVAGPDVTTEFEITLSDAHGGVSTPNKDVHVITKVTGNPFPVIVIDPGTGSSTVLDSQDGIRAFKGLTFADSDTLTVKITFKETDGDLTVPEGLEDYFDPALVSRAGGNITYFFKGTADELRVVMDLLKFDAKPQAGAAIGTVTKTVFTVEVTDDKHPGATGTINTIEVNAIAARTGFDTGAPIVAPSEVSSTGQEVGTLMATLGGRHVTYTLLDNAGGRFSLDEATGKVKVANGLLLDAEQAMFHTIRVKATVEGGATFEQVLTITLTNLAVENIYGSAASDVFFGGAGRDTLRGLGGNDKIGGGAGNDLLYGGVGKDVFVFNTAPNKSTNKDKIADWVSRDDTIHLENAIFKSLKKTGVLSSANFVVNAVAKDANDYIGYNKKTGDVWYDANGSKAGGQVVFANVGANKILTSADFFVI